MKGLIYKVTNKVSGKSYIGLTRYTLEFRWRQHLHKKDNTYFHNALRKYGEDKFTVEVLEECDVDKLNEREIFYIAKYDTFNNGYNLTLGGEGKRLVLDDKYDEIKGLYLSGFSSNKIATLYNVDKASIIKILKALGVKIRNNKLNFNALEWKELVEDYLSGHSFRSLAKRYDCSAPALKELFIRKGVDIRKRYSILEDDLTLLSLINDYLDETTTLKLILLKYKCNYNTFTKILSLHGISRGKKHFKLSDKECLNTIKLFKEGYTVRLLASRFSVDVGTIYSLFKRYHIDYLTV